MSGRDTAVSARVSGGAASGTGAQLRQRPSTAFQQSAQVYCRHDRQKLKVRWNASSAVAVERCSVSERATANASSIDDPGSLTKWRSPRLNVPNAASGLRRLPPARTCSACHTARRRIPSGSRSSAPRGSGPAVSGTGPRDDTGRAARPRWHRWYPSAGSWVPMARVGGRTGASGRLSPVRAMSRVERFIERLVERPSARLFRTRLQPIQVLRRIERAMEAGRGANGTRPAWCRTGSPSGCTRTTSRRLLPAEAVASELASGALTFAQGPRLRPPRTSAGHAPARPRAPARRGRRRRRGLADGRGRGLRRARRRRNAGLRGADRARAGGRHRGSGAGQGRPADPAFRVPRSGSGGRRNASSCSRIRASRDGTHGCTPATASSS